MRSHGRGGSLLIVPPDSDAWRESIVQPIKYAVSPSFCELAVLMKETGAGRQAEVWRDALRETVAAIAGLTAIDGAAVLTENYELLAFGAKIQRRRGAAPVESVTVTEPIEGGVPTVTPPRTWRHAAFVGRAVRPRSTQRHRPGGIAGSALHGLRVVTMRRERARASRRVLLSDSLRANRQNQNTAAVSVRRASSARVRLRDAAAAQDRSPREFHPDARTSKSPTAKTDQQRVVGSWRISHDAVPSAIRAVT